MLIQLKQSGFTMIELVITIALLSVLATFAIPSYQQMIENSKIRTASESILTGLQLARAEAVKRNQNVQFELGAGNTSDWKICTQPSPAGACVAASVIHSRSQNDGSSSNVSVQPDQNGPYIFNSLGLMVSPATLINIDIGNDALAGSRDLRIVVAVGGSVKSCDPALDPAGTDPRKC